MVSLEQVKLLETKVVKAIEYVERLSEENTLLREKLDGYRNRIDELEVLVHQFKEDQGRIEEGIVSALTRLNQFEDSMEQAILGASSVPGNQRNASEPQRPTAPAAPDADSDEAILSALEAEEAEARRPIDRDEPPKDPAATDSATIDEDSDQAPAAAGKSQAAELDIF